MAPSRRTIRKRCRFKWSTYSEDGEMARGRRSMTTVMQLRVWIVASILCIVCSVAVGAAVALAQQEVAPAPGAPAPTEAPAASAPAPGAPAPPKIDTGDTAWLLTSSALVLAMTAPGLAIFYGGMVRRKNALNTMMLSFIILCIISVQWVLWGYSLAFGPDKGHVIGGLEWLGLNGVGLDPNPDYGATVPHQAFMIFQLMF